MITGLSNFAARLRGRFLVGDDVRSLILQNQQSATGNQQLLEPPHVGSYDKEFNSLALELFALQLKSNPAYRKICEGRKLMPGAVGHWTEIPVVPTAVFKELDLTCLPPVERIAVFHSSGTTEQKPSRHFHNAESLKLYEASLWPWFAGHVMQEFGVRSSEFGVLILTPPPRQAPHSSLVHMFETIRSRAGESADHSFFGTVAADGSWTLNFEAVVDALSLGSQMPDLDGSLKDSGPRSSRGNEAHPSKSEIGNSDKSRARDESRCRKSEIVRASSRRLLPFQGVASPLLLLGTAFSFVHLLDYLAERNLRFDLPAGSRVMETGGYKNRSRSMPRTELHQLITERLGVPLSHIICEYGMSELSSQAYNLGAPASRRRVSSVCVEQDAGGTPALPETAIRHFHFPPWARVQIISPETGREVADGETGLIRVFDLANVFSVMAIQTEDLGVRRGDGFELIGRAALAEARGCSLMTV